MNLEDLLVSFKPVNRTKAPVFEDITTLPDWTSYLDRARDISKKEESKQESEDASEKSPLTTEWQVRTLPSSQKSSLKWSNPFKGLKKEWVNALTSAYKKAGITNENTIKMLISQDALETGWGGNSAQGKFNYGNLTTGTKWKGDYTLGNDKDASGNPIKLKFRSYSSIDDYAADKILFLRSLYDFDENDDINAFTAKLTGANKGNRRYAEARDYANRVSSVYRSFRIGGILNKLKLFR